MTPDAILSYCLTKTGAYIDYPYGPLPVCVKVRGKLFAQLYPNPGDYKLTFNCDMAAGEFYRGMFPGRVLRGYHCPPVLQPYFSTVQLDADVPDEDVYAMLDHSYRRVTGKLPKAVRLELEQASQTP